MGSANSSLKLVAVPRSPGFAASITDQYSMRLFSTGVPDMAMKPSGFMLFTALKAFVR